VSAIRAAVEEVRLDEARMMADQTADALACQQSPVNPLLLTNLFQIMGAVAFFQGDPGETEAAFRRAVAVAPMSSLDARFGDGAAEAYSEAQKRVLAETIGNFGVLGEVEAWVDGRLIEPGTPIELPVGYHLLQWREDDGTTMHGETLRIASAEIRELPLGSNTLVDGRTNRRNHKSINWAPVARVGGGMLILGSSAVFLAGAAASRDFDQAEEPSELDSLRSRNHNLVLIGGGMALAGTGAIGASFIHGGASLSVGWRF
jgi:hypothetical protein